MKMNNMNMTGNNGTGDGMDMGGMDMSGMMMMYFHTGVKEYVLFEDLHISTAGEMGGACVAIFFFAMLYEGLKVLREFLLRRSLTSTNYRNFNTSGNGFSPDATIVDPNKKKANGTTACPSNEKETVSVHMLSGSHFIQTFLHMVQVFLSYCLMLVFMTYNVWLCIAVILGAAAGYFLFGWRRSVVVDINEHCH